MFRAHHHAGPVVWCAPNFTLFPNPASLISTMGEFRVYLPRCPLARGVYFVTRLHEADIFQYHSVRKLWSLALRSSGHSRSQRHRGPSRRRLRWGRCRRNTEPGPRRVCGAHGGRGCTAGLGTSLQKGAGSGGTEAILHHRGFLPVSLQRKLAGRGV